MKRPRTILLILLALLIVPLVLMMWPEGPLDLSKDEEPFRSMALPPQSVTGDIIMDGGSVLVMLIDRNGHQSVFHFYIDKQRVINRHPTAGYGIEFNGKETPLKDPERAKMITIRLLKDYGNNRDEGITRAINGLSNPVSDIAERFYGKSKNLFHEWTGF